MTRHNNSEKSAACGNDEKLQEVIRKIFDELGIGILDITDPYW